MRYAADALAAVPGNEALSQLGSTRDSLGAGDAAHRLERDGPNELGRGGRNTAMRGLDAGRKEG